MNTDQDSPRFVATMNQLSRALALAGLVAAVFLSSALWSDLHAEEKDTFGLHVVTYHSPNIYCDNGKNPGLYYSHEDTGATVGTYYNSCERQSYYAGWHSPEVYGFGFMVAGVTGYVKPITPMIAPTFSIPLDKTISLRISGGSWDGMDVYHLSVEARF